MHETTRAGIIAVYFLIIFFSPAHAQVHSDEWRFQYKPLAGAYELYSGELSEPRPAGSSGASLSIRIDKEAARQMFAQMGPDVPNLCPSEPGERMRQKNDLTCYRSRSGKHSCYVGFDLGSGKSKAGNIC